MTGETFTLLREALFERMKERGPSYDFYDDRGPFSTIYDDLGHALATWEGRAVRLMNPYYWRITALVEVKELRKPKVFLAVDITKKGNLVLEWFPWDVPQGDIERTDWAYWTDYRPVGSGMTENRLIMVHDFEHHIRNKSRLASQAYRYLIEAMRCLLDDIFAELSNYFELTVMYDLNIEYANNSDSTIKNISILSTKEIEEEKVLRSRQEWLDSLPNKFHLSVEALLTLFGSCDANLSKTCRKLSQEYRVRIGETALRNVITRLYQEFPQIYDRTLQ